MSGRGDIQKQLLQVISIINAQGYDLEDVMPDEMRDYFQDMTALKEARTYIKDIESREKELQAKNASLLMELKSKQAKIDEQPLEFKAMNVDLQQSQHQIDYYKGLADNAQIRAERYQRKFAEAFKLQTTADDDARKIQRLERDLIDREAAIYKLIVENRATTDLYEAQHEEHLRIIEEKNHKITAMINHYNQLEAETAEAIEDHVKVSEVHDSLIDTLEQDSMTTVEAFNLNSAKLLNRLDLSDQVHSTIASELALLHSFYEHTFSILDIYQFIFQNLSDPTSRIIPSIPKSLDEIMDAANDKLYSWQHVSADLHAHNSVQGEVLCQVDDMVNVAARIYTSLESIKDFVSGFLDRLRSDPDALTTTKGLVGGNSKVFSTPVQDSISSRSSISSFASFAKRFSMA